MEDREIRDRINAILIAWNMPTRQAAISEIMELLEATRTSARAEGAREEAERANEMRTIYELKLHEYEYINAGPFKISVTRVPGGWIYTYEVDGLPTVFVPWHNEFQDGLEQHNGQ